MPTVDDAAILARAKEFCRQNAAAWDDLTADKRQRYLSRAREQLLTEISARGGAAEALGQTGAERIFVGFEKD